MGELLYLKSWQDTPVLFHPFDKALDVRRERKKQGSRKRGGGRHKEKGAE